MYERQAKVLSALINEYIRTGEPVSSKQLAGKGGLSLSPASIRSVMHDLCKTGFIYQPHTSAGRIPTDSGYRYYLDNLNVSDMPDSVREKLHRRWERIADKYGSRQVAMAEILAQITRSLALVASLKDSNVVQSGVSNLFDDRGEPQIDLMQEISIFLDNSYRMVEEMAEVDSNVTTVYVGEENPYFASRHISLILHSGGDKEKDKTLVILVGPKRMRYRQHLSLLNEIEGIFKS